MTARTIEARAPGKLFLTGEWVVLAGAPAVVAAVDRYAVVRCRLLDGPGALRVESLAEGRIVLADDALCGGDAGAVAAALAAAGEAERTHGEIVVDTGAFLVGERKLGLGRSAATLAAATAAVLAHRGRRGRGELCHVALAANARFQAGLGSGADVAAAVHGGVVAVRRVGERLDVAPLTLPAGLHLLAGWTGTSAPTTRLLERFAALPTPATLAPLAEVSAVAVDALLHGDPVALGAAVNRAGDLLEALGDETGLPIITPELTRLVDIARRHGAAAKPSGAGGGDCGIALATSPHQAAAVRAGWQEAGILPLTVAIATEGTTVA